MVNVYKRSQLRTQTICIEDTVSNSTSPTKKKLYSRANETEFLRQRSQSSFSQCRIYASILPTLIFMPVCFFECAWSNDRTLLLCRT